MRHLTAYCVITVIIFTLLIAGATSQTLYYLTCSFGGLFLGHYLEFNSLHQWATRHKTASVIYYDDKRRLPLVCVALFVSLVIAWIVNYFKV